MKRLSRYLPLIVLLALAAILLSGCGGVTTDPTTGEQVYNEGVLEIIAKPMREVMVFFHDRLSPLGVIYAWGWAIILVAVLIRLLLLPLGLRQMRSMRVAQVKMQALQPELDAMKKKYAKDKQKLQEEQMKLYQKHGIMQAQMAGCLPTLLQMPILIAFYYALLGLVVTDEFQNAPFYFIPNLAYPSYNAGLSWLTQDFSLEKLLSPDVWPYLVLPIVLAITQYVMTKMSQASQPAPDPSNPASNMMGQMAILMTGMFVFFSLQVPSGVSLYWAVGNLLAMAQQLYVNRQKVHWAQEVAPIAATAVEASEPEPEEETRTVSANGKGKYASDSATVAADLSESSATPRRKRRRRR